MRKVNKHSKRIKGFTLIELLVVIVVIGILATIALVSFMASQAQTRDANRKSDISQYKAALALYASKNGGYYPSYTGATSLSSTVCNTMDHPNCAEDPNSDDGAEYLYISNGDVASPGSPTATFYAIWVDMESTGDLWINCSTGETGNGESTPTVDNCTVD